MERTTTVDNITMATDFSEQLKFKYKYVSPHYFSFIENEGFGYFIIFIACLGCLGNLAASVTIIARHLYRQSSIFIFLAFIHSMDVIFCIFWGLLYHALPLLIDVSLVYNLASVSSLLSLVYCRVVFVTIYTSVVASAWVTVSANITKLAAMLFPFGVMARGTNRIAVMSSVASILVGLALFVPTYPFIVSGEATRVSTNEGVVLVVYGCVRDNAETFAIALSRYAEIIMYSTLPGCLLVLLSIAILVVFRRNYKKHKQLTSQRSGKTGGSRDPGVRGNLYESARNSVTMLLPLSVVHIATTFPVQIVQLFEMYGHKSLLSHYVVGHIVDFNHAINVFVQLAVSKTYRHAMFGIK